MGVWEVKFYSKIILRWSRINDVASPQLTLVIICLVVKCLMVCWAQGSVWIMVCAAQGSVWIWAYTGTTTNILTRKYVFKQFFFLIFRLMFVIKLLLKTDFDSFRFFWKKENCKTLHNQEKKFFMSKLPVPYFWLTTELEATKSKLSGKLPDFFYFHN